MCDPVTLMTAAASAASTVIGITQQVQRAQAQQADYSWLAAQQRTAAAADEQRARVAEQQGEGKEQAQWLRAHEDILEAGDEGRLTPGLR